MGGCDLPCHWHGVSCLDLPAPVQDKQRQNGREYPPRLWLSRHYQWQVWSTLTLVPLIIVRYTVGLQIEIFDSLSICVDGYSQILDGHSASPNLTLPDPVCWWIPRYSSKRATIFQIPHGVQTILLHVCERFNVLSRFTIVACCQLKDPHESFCSSSVNGQGIFSPSYWTAGSSLLPLFVFFLLFHWSRDRL